ncbi:hypothetical protein LF41_1708 [Lysobacter dokdonensis DS-58]|uniref:Secreted protein n=1 Tax=Lysobacter dokdonensis DS-58 TaxID=1300345 RepID=A0A0A2WHW0_9GAMM|nr:hypothetical protein [Lysobacter dokdonensis]KGQ17855.1 hypothetical protein LF41_1708 [Lysobacter dokdonensis DS-58]
MLRSLLFAAALLASTQAHAALVDIDLIDRDTGRWLPETPFRGDTWVAGAPGHRYAVRLTNTTGERVLVVLSVDGVNAVTGQTARPSQAGYVLEPWQSTEVAGWRKSLDDIAQFVFTDLPDSYAARTGRPRNVGVVGIAVFREARPVVYEYETPPQIARDAAQPAPAAPRAQSSAKAAAESSAQQQRLGTGHGAREWSRVERTDFVRATRSPTQVTELRYDDYDTLAAIGVYPRPRPHHWRDAPRAFPNGFVADPPGG